MKVAPKAIKERLALLKKSIEKHRYNYHVLDKQDISDEALDSLKRELVDIETVDVAKYGVPSALCTLYS